MGQKLSFCAADASDEADKPLESDDSVAFFRRLSLKWVKTFTNRAVEAGSVKELDIYDSTALLTWKNYFKIISELKERIEVEEEVGSRAVWHPACSGFTMEKVEMSVNASDRSKVNGGDGTIGKGDDWTDDEKSDDGDEPLYVEDDNLTEAEVEILTKNADDQLRHSFKLPGDEDDGTESRKHQVVSTGDGGSNANTPGAPGTTITGTSTLAINRSLPKDPLRSDHKSGFKDSETVPKRKDVAQNWNSSIYSPIFFGSAAVTVREHEKRVAEEIERLKMAEQRACDKARGSRSEILDSFERVSKNQADARQKKIDELDDAYKKAQMKREELLSRNQRELPTGAFKIFKLDWGNENSAAAGAYEEEMVQLKFIHNKKTSDDAEALRHKREDLEAFKDAESQEIPAADKLESIARVEISRWIDELEQHAQELEKAKLQFQDIVEDFHKIQNIAAKKALSKQQQEELAEIKALLVGAENAVKQKQRALEDGLGSLADAEVLFERAVRMKAQQEQVLPLFTSLQDSENPEDVLANLTRGASYTCRLDLMIIAVTVLMKGNFDQKFNFFFHLFDSAGEGTFNCTFVARVIFLFQVVFRKLHLLPYLPLEAEMINLVQRGYMDVGLDCKKDVLTNYEVKVFVTTLVSNSKKLVQALGVNAMGVASNISTYQRNKMSALTLLMQGMIGQNTCKYRIHYESTRFKPQLEPRKKQDMHERALAMGDEDPLKIDFSKFIAKPEKKGKGRVEPLDHGHLLYAKYIEGLKQRDAATKIQAMARSYKDRRVAELAAKRQAFLDAKDAAMREMKSKIMNEFKKREALTGMGKMKWDAQVRLRQAKIRATGQSASRADVVMIMMEELINKSRQDIEVRFLKIEAKEDFKGIDFGEKVVIEDEPAKVIDVAALFGMIAKPAVADTSVLPDTISTPRPDDDSEPAGADSGGHSDAIRVDVERSTDTILGKYTWSASARGETVAEFELRAAMALPDPPMDHLVNRLRALDSAVTVYKCREIIGEMPSKRLLLKFAESLSFDAMEQQLSSHFKFKRSQEKLAEALKAIARTDREHGLALIDVTALQYKVEGGLLVLNKINTDKAIHDLDSMLMQKLATNENAQEKHVISSEVKRIGGLFRKFKEESDVLTRDMEQIRNKYKRVALSCGEMQRKVDYVLEWQERRRHSVVSDVVVSLDERQAWMTRLANANLLGEKTAPEREVKYGEIRSVCREFVDTATADAMIIISENFHPRHRKTIMVRDELTVHGRKESGRGVDGSGGKYYEYEAHNIHYKVCEDYNGIFDGSDECAAKAWGKDRAVSLEYYKIHFPQLNLPLVATIDFGGFRVLATSILPTERATFNDEGELRKLTEDFVHGVQNYGESFANRSKAFSQIMKRTASTLNLAEHWVQAETDIGPTVAYCSSEIKAYKGKSDEFFVKDFWRGMPSELPEETPHLLRSPRDQSVFWRQLRPEFVRHYHKPLSPDASSVIVLGQADEKEHYATLRSATKQLVTDDIPSFVNILLARKYTVPLSNALGLDLTVEMHSHGLNMRHLGLCRSLICRTLPGTVNAFFSEAVIRTSRDMREEVAHGDVIYLNGNTYKVDVTPERPISPRYIPVEPVYLGATTRNARIVCGAADRNDENNDSLRSVFLAEIVARTMKQLIRMELRIYAKKTRCISYQVKSSLICEYLNVLTGSGAHASGRLQEQVYEGARQRFGAVAVRPSDRENMQNLLKPCIIYAVKRVMAMMGVNLSLNCLSEFTERPYTFTFTPLDLLDIRPVVRHNFPLLPFSDAAIATVQADIAASSTYLQAVVDDKPTLFLRLSERKGSRTGDNKGSIGSDFICYFSTGCVLEQPGPITTDPFTRSVLFHPGAKSIVDTKFHTLIVPQTASAHFTVEGWFQCSGGADTLRVALMSGRYGIVASRDNYWTFILIEGMYDIYVRIAEVDRTPKWVHIMCTYDGTILRCYFNSELAVSLETAGPMKLRSQGMEDAFRTQLEQINEEEEAERRVVKAVSAKEAELYFNSKEGIVAMKRASQSILETREFQEQRVGSDAKDEATARVQKSQEAQKQAKNQYQTDTYLKNVRSIAEKFKQMRDDLEDKIKRERDEGALRMRKSLRIGGALSTGSDKQGKSFFYGCVSSVAVYDRCLSADRAREHYTFAAMDRTRDAQRLYAVAGIKYEEALTYAAEDPVILRGYARALCEYLKIELNRSTQQGITKGKLKLLEMIRAFKARRMADAIAEILVAIPHEVLYQDIVCEAFDTVMCIDKHYFSKGMGVERKDLVHIPRAFALDNTTNKKEFIRSAAGIYQEVMREPSLRFSYGELDMGWITELKSPEIVVALMRSFYEDANLSVLRLGEMFRSASSTVSKNIRKIDNSSHTSDAAVTASSISVSDDDVRVLSGYLVLSIGFDLSGCSAITNIAMSYIARVRTLKILNIDGCHLINDVGLQSIIVLAENLEVLSMKGLNQITDDGVTALARECKTLKVLNVSYCPYVSHESIVHMTTANVRMTTLHLAATYLTDEGLSLITRHLSRKFFTSLDVSFCRDITDGAILSISENCPNLKHLNLCSCSRVTDVGTRAILARCWYLETINFEDVFLLADNAFWFDRDYDGRPAANENMLKSLTFVSIRDCINITDTAVKGLSLRCKKIENLSLRGCDKITDKALAEMTTPYEDSYSLSDSLKTFDISYCAQVSSTGILKLLPSCGILEEINLSGIVTVDNDFIYQLCLVCPTIQRLVLQKCVLLTDVALCSIADYLWIEMLDISSCNRITDDGVDVLSSVCTGIHELVLSNITKLSDRTVYSLSLNCKALRRLNITNCGLITTEAVDEMRRLQMNTTIVR